MLKMDPIGSFKLPRNTLRNRGTLDNHIPT